MAYGQKPKSLWPDEKQAHTLFNPCYQLYAISHTFCRLYPARYSPNRFRYSRCTPQDAKNEFGARLVTSERPSRSYLGSCSKRPFSKAAASEEARHSLAALRDVGRILKTRSLRGRKERKTEAYSQYVEALSEVRTTQGTVFSILPIRRPRPPRPTLLVASALPWRYAGAS